MGKAKSRKLNFKSFVWFGIKFGKLLACHNSCIFFHYPQSIQSTISLQLLYIHQQSSTVSHLPYKKSWFFFMGSRLPTASYWLKSLTPNTNLDELCLHFDNRPCACRLYLLRTKAFWIYSKGCLANTEYYSNFANYFLVDSVPEVISLPITGGNLKYLEWIKNSTRENWCHGLDGKPWIA